MPHEKFTPNFTLDQERLRKLKELVPEAFVDGKISWAVLRGGLGQTLEEEGESAEHFGLSWPGKRKARQIAFTPSTGTLVPVKGEGVNEDEAKNIFIEGENLEVLKLLQKSYEGKIKMIYIDPPYNTGEDRIYSDDFAEPLEEYLKRNGNIDDDGLLLTTNIRADGRFHSKWLSMMLPRLLLARNLLREDGVIFVSIDDIEVSHLRQIMNEVFGEENFEALINWRRRHNQPNDKSKMIGKVSEHILVYSRNSAKLKEEGTYYGVPLSKDRLSDYTNPDKDPKGEWSSNPWKAAVGRGGSTYQITTPAGKKYTETWYGSEETFEQHKKDGRVYWTDDGKGLPRIKIYLSEALKDGQPAINFLKHEEFGTNQEGSAELEEIMGEPGVFENPKPTKLLKALIRVATRGNDIVLDFFAGSCTTAQAVLEANIDDKSDRSFILCQLPVASKHPKWKTLAELGKERVRRAIDRLVKAKKLNAAGFYVFKLDRSNFRKWTDYAGTDLKELTGLFDGQSDPLRENWKRRDLLTEILLHEGVQLTAAIRKEAAIKKNDILAVHSNERRLLICLDEKFYADSLEAITLGESDTLICLDSALTDEQKLRLADKGLIKTI